MSVDRKRLLTIARRFRIAGEEAEALVDEVLSAFLLNDPGGFDPQARLEGRMKVACQRRLAAAERAGLDPLRLRAIFPSLPLETRLVLKLHAFHGLNAQGVAVLMDIPLTSAAVLIAMAVEYAKKFLE